jgi:hypothetical protein
MPVPFPWWGLLLTWTLQAASCCQFKGQYAGLYAVSVGVHVKDAALRVLRITCSSATAGGDSIQTCCA